MGARAVGVGGSHSPLRRGLFCSCNWTEDVGSAPLPIRNTGPSSVSLPAFVSPLEIGGFITDYEDKPVSGVKDDGDARVYRSATKIRMLIAECSLVTCWIVSARLWSCACAFDQFMFESIKALCRVCHELWCASSPFHFTDAITGPRRTTRPVPHHYIRLVTNLEPSVLTESEPIKSEMEVDRAPDAKEPEWMKDQKWWTSGV